MVFKTNVNELSFHIYILDPTITHCYVGLFAWNKFIFFRYCRNKIFGVPLHTKNNV